MPRMKSTLGHAKRTPVAELGRVRIFRLKVPMSAIVNQSLATLAGPLRSHAKALKYAGRRRRPRLRPSKLPRTVAIGGTFDLTHPARSRHGVAQSGSPSGRCTDSKPSRSSARRAPLSGPHPPALSG
jgi:hypothetical protein